MKIRSFSLKKGCNSKLVSGVKTTFHISKATSQNYHGTRLFLNGQSQFQNAPSKQWNFRKENIKAPDKIYKRIKWTPSRKASLLLSGG